MLKVTQAPKFHPRSFPLPRATREGIWFIYSLHQAGCLTLDASDTENKRDSHPCPLGVYSLVGRQTIHSKANEFNNTGLQQCNETRGEWEGRGQPDRMVRKGPSMEMKCKLAWRARISSLGDSSPGRERTSKRFEMGKRLSCSRTVSEQSRGDTGHTQEGSKGVIRNWEVTPRTRGNQ